MRAQTFDISSGGAPTITGSVGGTVSGSSVVTNNLSVTVNFGELSPSNTNGIVKVTVPVAVRSTQPYQVTATLTFTSGASAQAVQKADVGFGMNNWHSMGANSRVCSNSPHIIYSPFNNDPSTGITISSAGRATYTSDLAHVGTSIVVLSGPRLSQTAQASRRTDNGYIFNAIFCITPQYYAAGSTTATITFTIGAGPSVTC
ncbi:MAG: hypothetical protein JO314_00430 [Acidobacteria bacterium]|nr:hypothetical protein [Acidobacteriota bacterium]